MPLTISIPEGYLGACANSLSDLSHDADHAEWVEFEANPQSDALMESLGLPPIRGCWHHVCADHCDPTAKHKA